MAQGRRGFRLVRPHPVPGVRRVGVGGWPGGQEKVSSRFLVCIGEVVPARLHEGHAGGHTDTQLCDDRGIPD